MSPRACARALTLLSRIGMLSGLGGSLLCAGCNVTGTIIDKQKFAISVRNMRLENPDGVQIFHGGTVRTVPLSAIESAEIFPDDFKTVDRELCYRATITLRNDGRLSGTSHGTADSVKATAYIGVNNAIVGTTKDGEFRIGLENVVKISLTK